MLSVTHIMPVLVLLSVVGAGMQHCMIQIQNEMHKLSKSRPFYKQANTYANMQLTINGFRPLFRDKIFSMTLPRHFSDISPTAVKIPDISRFSIQVVTLLNATIYQASHKDLTGQMART